MQTWLCNAALWSRGTEASIAGAPNLSSFSLVSLAPSSQRCHILCDQFIAEVDYCCWLINFATAECP
ncbi:hypothetical protein F0562_035987 [Nyssa sinensis]|uniref:Uncharacterized protein n=1 Tax=Nyssa sinensis TaxID=561372 RepID=A0A5J5AFL6_9ASTE|nr:hypothetical protein F0562_035987 [Nyssa sinensis]